VGNSKNNTYKNHGACKGKYNSVNIHLISPQNNPISYKKKKMSELPVGKAKNVPLFVKSDFILQLDFQLNSVWTKTRCLNDALKHQGYYIKSTISRTKLPTVQEPADKDRKFYKLNVITCPLTHLWRCTKGPIG